MSAAEEKKAFTTPRWVQAWFLQKSRDNWKRKYMALKKDTKRWQNRVRDVSKSREKWRQESTTLRQRIQELETRNAELQAQLASFKKDGPVLEVGSVSR